MPGEGYEIEKTGKVYFQQKSKRSPSPFFELSKVGLYLLLHAIFIGAILLYQAVWLFSETTTAYCYAYNEEQLLSSNENPGTLVYHYIAGNKMYRETTTRNEFPLTVHTIEIRYLSFMPSISRVNNFYDNWLGYIMAWIIFFVISSLIFFIPNETMPKNSFFYFTSQRPWIHMIVK